MIELKMASHGVLPGKQMVECWQDGLFVAGIYPHQDGVRVVSKYLTGVAKEKKPVHHGGECVPSAIIKPGKEVKDEKEDA